MAPLENSTDNANNGDNTSIRMIPSLIVLDHNHPLYLHASDGLGSMSVGLILTGMENYSLWSRVMKVALLGKTKLCLVDGSTEDFGPNLGSQWDRCNAIVTSWLMSNVRRDLQARSQILLMPSLPSIHKAYSMVVREESRKSFTGGTYWQTGHNNPTALFTAQSISKPRRNYSLECDFCHMKGHTRNECYKLMRCEFCNKTRHLKENCYKIISYHSDFKQKKKANVVMIDGSGQQGVIASPTTSIYQPSSNVKPAQFFTKEQYNQLLQLLNKGSTAGTSANMADKCFCGNVALCENLKLCKSIVDTGATNHMIGDKSLLKNETSVGNSGQVQLPNGDSTSISHMGNVNSQEDLLSGRVKEIGRREEDLYILSTALGKTVNTAFAATRKEGGHDKFAPRVMRSVFLGYAAHQKGYRLLDLENRVFFIRRDVVFYEDIFPFHIAEGSSKSLFLDKIPVPRQDFDEELKVVSSATDTHIEGTNMSCSPSLTPVILDEQDISHPIEYNSMDSPDDSLILPDDGEPRKSTRVSKPPIWLMDYARDDKRSSTICCTYPISEVIGYDSISSRYQSYLANFSVEMEPTLYSEAVKDKRWVEAMQAEIKALDDNKTWELVSLPQGQKAIGCK
ncbi:uncharacterized protein [Nicotiana sylvestris]|uniref:uncharacterized protein n=1 Tax=Nicotiana sylvestris TaxID=4096 RepID=UPI00388C8718